MGRRGLAKPSSSRVLGGKGGCKWRWEREWSARPVHIIPESTSTSNSYERAPIYKDVRVTLGRECRAGQKTRGSVGEGGLSARLFSNQPDLSPAKSRRSTVLRCMYLAPGDTFRRGGWDHHVRFSVSFATRRYPSSQSLTAVTVAPPTHCAAARYSSALALRDAQAPPLRDQLWYQVPSRPCP